MPREKKPKKRQIELDFSDETLPIRYRFAEDGHYAYLRELVEGKIDKLLGNGDRVARRRLTPVMRQKINDTLDGHGLRANFNKKDVEIVAGPSDITGEYYEGYVTK